MERRLLALYADPLVVDGQSTLRSAEGSSRWSGVVAFGIVAPLIVPFRIEQPLGADLGLGNRGEDRAEPAPSGAPSKSWARPDLPGDSTDLPITIFRNLGAESVEVRMERREDGVFARVRWVGPRPSVATHTLERIDDLGAHDPRAWELVRKSLRPSTKSARLFGGAVAIESPPRPDKEH